MNGLFGTEAALWSDLSLVITIVLGGLAAYGGVQAHKKKFSSHCPLMAVAALLNWIPVLMVMIPTFIALLQGTKNLASGPFASVPIFHSVLGTITQFLMTYTVVRMYWGHSLPPKKTIWLMRVTMLLWFMTVIGGIGVYVVSYVL